jgi:isoleucyl-tRNA synthetase
VVDGHGKKMSKSVGNVVVPQEVIDKYGAEVLRLWVSSENYHDDIKVSDEILRRVSDTYRKMRNTIRFLLSNLSDFDPAKDMVSQVSEFSELDRWALSRYASLVRRVTRAYDEYEFHAIYHSLHNFCGVVVSSIYMDVLKDRLYCSAADDKQRRAAQSVIYRILDGLLKLMSPVLCFTTAEAWEHLHKLAHDAPLEGSVFFTRFPGVDDIEEDKEFEQRWQRLLILRGEVTRVLEVARRDKIIGLSLDAEVVLAAKGELHGFLNKNVELLKELCIVSNLLIVDDDNLCDRGGEQKEEDGSSKPLFVPAEETEGLLLSVGHAPGGKCERCWVIASSVGADEEHSSLCDRCLRVVRELS